MDPITAAVSNVVSLDLLTMIQQFVNIKAVLLAVAGTQALKYYLPCPLSLPVTVTTDSAGEKSVEQTEGQGPLASGSTSVRSSAVVPGSWTTRMLPFVPLLIALIVTFVLEYDSKFTSEDFVRGILSGMLASYGYRTTKVVFFGA